MSLDDSVDESFLESILNEADEDINIEAYAHFEEPVPEEENIATPPTTHPTVSEDEHSITINEEDEQNEEAKVNELLEELDVDDDADEDFIASLQKHATVTEKMADVSEIDNLLKHEEENEHSGAEFDIEDILAEQDEIIPDEEEYKPSPRKSKKQALHNTLLSRAQQIMRITPMTRITEFMNLTDTRIDIGSSRVIKTSTTLLAIGTSQGVVVVFPNNSESVAIMREVEAKFRMDINQYNGVTSMDITPTGDCIVAGYERGQVIVWDTKTNAIIKKMTEMFNTAVDNVEFLRDKDKIVASSQGVVKLVHMNRVLFTVYSDIKTVVDNSFGSVRHLKVLPTAQAPHPTNDFLIVGIATGKEIIVMTLRPTVRVIYRLMRPTNIPEGALPYLAWRRVLSPTKLFHEQSGTTVDNTKGRHPILAIGWGHVLNLFQLHKQEQLELFRISCMELPANREIIGLAWLGERVVSILDGEQYVSVVDPFALQTVERKSIRELSLIHHDRFDQMDKDGRTVLVSCPSYHNSHHTCNEVMHMLGNHQLITMKVLTWRERIDALIDINCWDDALRLGLDFYQGNGVAVVGLPTDTERLQQMTGAVIENVLLRYLKEFQHDDDDDHINYYNKLGKTCVEYALAINRTDLVFGPIWDKFKDKEMSDNFTSLLEHFILNGQLKQVPRYYLDTLIRIYTERNLQSRLEALILNLDVSQLDLMDYCRKNHLWKALIYILNNRDDYIEPIRLLLKVENEHETLYTYLQKCFAGEAYPSGQIPHTRLGILKREMLKTIFGQPDILRSIASINSTRFFEILRFIFADNSPTTPWKNNTDSDLTRQDIADELLALFLDRTKDPFNVWEFSDQQFPKIEDLVMLFLFLIKFIAESIIVINSDTLHRMFAILGYEANIYDSDKNTTQSYLVNILKLHNPSTLQVPRLINVCDKADYTKVSIYLQTLAGNYDKVLDAYLKDNELKNIVFQYIHQRMTGVDTASEVYIKIKEATLSHLSQLIHLNSDATAHLIILHFTSEYDRVLSLLKPFPKLQFDYLKNIIGIEKTSSTMTDLLKEKNIQVSEDVLAKFFALLCQFEPTSVLHFLKAQNNYKLDECLELCRKYGILDACSFLLERAGDIPGAIGLYMDQLKHHQVDLRTRLVIEAKKIDSNNDKYRNIDSFEVIGSQTRRALAQLNQPIVTQVNVLPRIKMVKKDKNKDKDTTIAVDVSDLPEACNVRSTLASAVQMVQRAADTSILSAEESVSAWFELIDDFLRPLRELRLGYQGTIVSTDSISKSYKKMETKIDSDDEDSDLDSTEITPQEQVEEIEEGIQKLKERIASTQRALSQESSSKNLKVDTTELSQNLIKLNRRLNGMIQLKTEAIQRVQESEQEKERMAKDPLAAHNIPKLTNLWLQRVLAKCVRYIYEGMLGYVKLDQILELTMKKYRNDEYGHFKESLHDVYDNLSYESMLYHSIKGLIDRDNFWLHFDYITKQKRGLRPLSRSCFLCMNPLMEMTEDDDEEGSEIKIFNCGHSYHINCLDSINVTACTICNTKKQQKNTAHAFQPQRSGKKTKKLTLKKKQLARRVEMQLEQQSKVDIFTNIDQKLDDLYRQQLNRGGKPPPPSEEEKVSVEVNPNLLPKVAEASGDLVASFDDFFN